MCICQTLQKCTVKSTTNFCDSTFFRVKFDEMSPLLAKLNSKSQLLLCCQCGYGLQCCFKKQVSRPYCRADVYTDQVACYPLVSRGKYANGTDRETNRQTDRRQIVTLHFLLKMASVTREFAIGVIYEICNLKFLQNIILI